MGELIAGHGQDLATQFGHQRGKARVAFVARQQREKWSGSRSWHTNKQHTHQLNVSATVLAVFSKKPRVETSLINLGDQEKES